MTGRTENLHGISPRWEPEDDGLQTGETERGLTGQPIFSDTTRQAVKIVSHMTKSDQEDTKTLKSGEHYPSNLDTGAIINVTLND